jgi:hypothetical protein
MKANKNKTVANLTEVLFVVKLKNLNEKILEITDFEQYQINYI